jgi:hypothetical protein
MGARKDIRGRGGYADSEAETKTRLLSSLELFFLLLLIKMVKHV